MRHPYLARIVKVVWAECVGRVPGFFFSLFGGDFGQTWEDVSAELARGRRTPMGAGSNVLEAARQRGMMQLERMRGLMGLRGLCHLRRTLNGRRSPVCPCLGRRLFLRTTYYRGRRAMRTTRTHMNTRRRKSRV